MINLEKEIREQPKVLSDVGKVNEKTIINLVKELKERGVDNVYFVARGTSDHACIFAQYLFGITMGMNCTLATPSIFTQYNSKINFHNTLVVGVSQSGRAEDVCAVLKSANDQGMITVAITNYEDSLLAKNAKYHLFCAAGEEVSIAATKTFTSQMYLLSMLCAYWSGNEALKNELNNISKHMENALTYIPASANEIAKEIKDTESGVILGRGLAYPIALEGALKILETNNKKMRGYPISDFYHGPVAQLHKDDLAMVIAQSGPMYNDAIKMIDKLNSVGAKVVVITDNKELANKEKSIYIENTGFEFSTMFLVALAVQFIALQLVLERGINPDKSNVIAKITVTK